MSVVSDILRKTVVYAQCMPSEPHGEGDIAVELWKKLELYGMRPASPMVRRKRDFLEWEFTKKMNAVGL